MKTKTRSGTSFAPDRRRSSHQPKTTTPETPREVRYFWPLVVVIAAATGVLLVWAGLQTTSVVETDDVAFSSHDAGIEMALREQEAARHAAIASAHDSAIAAQVQGRERDLFSVHDSGIARQLQVQGEREAFSAAHDSVLSAQLRLHTQDREAAIASAYDSGLAAAVRTKGERATAIASAYDAGLAAAVKEHGGTEMLSSGCPPTAPNSGGWEVQQHRAGC